MDAATRGTGVLGVLLLATACLPVDDAAPAAPVAASAAAVVPSRASETERPRATAVAADPLLRAARGGDGDSWRDTAGREYRLGMVNAPEVGDCFGSQATVERKRLVAKGFRARVYAKDRYGRGVSVVTTAAGAVVNVELARHGFADDRYLAQFRSEDPALARQLDAAFAAAKAERAGLWSACTQSAPAPQGLVAAPRTAAADRCHPDYATCIPIAGDGSGRGSANDLDCGDLPGPVALRQVGVDPYRLDGNGDGTGCN